MTLAALVAAVLAAPRAHAAISPDDWLGEINAYRAAAGVPPVTDQPAWDAGIESHLSYLQNTPSSYFTGAYQSVHTENPGSPYYTPAGALEAGYSNLSEGGNLVTPVAAIDSWLTTPFHAIAMLGAQLAQVAFALYPASTAPQPAAGYAGLDVAQGLNSSLPAAPAPILFPGAGMTTDLGEPLANENPDPYVTCGWQSGPEPGMPLIALLQQAPDPALTATLSRPDGTTESSGAGDLCIIDQNTYVSPDPVYGPGGAATLTADHAVLLAPRVPLQNGPYTATIRQPGQADIAWSFTEYEPAPTNTQAPTIQGLATVGNGISVTDGSWTGTPNQYVYSWMRCDATGPSCAATGATSAAYTVTLADVGHTLRASVTARNRGGLITTALSAPTQSISAPNAGPAHTIVVSRFPSHGQALRLALRLGVRRATLTAPPWTAGRLIRIVLTVQRKVCVRGACQWRTLSSRALGRHFDGRRTTFPVPLPRRSTRLVVSVTTFDFKTADGYLYRPQTVTAKRVSRAKKRRLTR